MIVSPNLGLIIANLQTDPYSSDDNAANLARLDQHDHTPGKGLQISSAALADGLITNAKLAVGLTATPTDGSVTLTKLASDVKTDYGYSFGTYKTLFIRGGASPGNLTTASTPYILYSNTATTLGATTSSTDVPKQVVYLDSADYPAGTRTAYLRLRLSIINLSATASNSTYVVKILTPSTLSAGGFSAGFTSAGTATIPTPAGNSITTAVSADMSFSSAGLRGLVLDVSGANENVSVMAVATLQIRHV